MGVRYGFVVDLRRCTGCYSCQISCKSENGVTLSQFRTKLQTVYQGNYPAPKSTFVSLRCNQCENPVCASKCPVKATYKIDNGITVVDTEKCIACGNCIALCPYGARYIDKGNPERLNKVDKCDYCQHRLAAGLQPACVTNCFGKAMYFGDLNDPNSKVSQLIKTEKVQVLKTKFNTDPKCFYIVDDKHKAE
ncbi:hypothetical protein BHU72_07140 [Desulfuribacillus stibiiarsenatis]|uniref:4Fe-4S ferredoxin-type domain-containing protein n=1 Tax=Desulfuribacillus stibiiarsenatis TaxID=1390249 RepID=A0A1E5L4Q7_9FIRM|nr:4Fe-4S dicluster domain-containing protein [Desulfuribacillus stibiiarsenatis]OEH84959.1 hypothetical protein BHU72_07140 [Desulfuribacillus stibiiarsenatis]